MNVDRREMAIRKLPSEGLVEYQGLDALAMRVALLADFGLHVAASVNHANDADS